MKRTGPAIADPVVTSAPATSAGKRTPSLRPRSIPSPLKPSLSSMHGRPVLITGGAGFVGCNLAHRLLSSGRRVIIYDNLSRSGVSANFAWLRRRHGNRVELMVADVRDYASLSHAATLCDSVYHLAAQVAVTSSLINPIEDFEVNVRGTLNLLEALRRLESPPPLIYTSTNKVYGELSDIALKRARARFVPRDPDILRKGIPARQLAFHSPYGCSKGAADQYVLDYARTFGLPATVFRMSCIYGPHQFGNEDQGWVAHFLVRTLQKKSITVYGDGRQVRDVLFVDDLVDALLAASDHIDKLHGTAFNIGGGPNNTTSLLELLDLIEEVNGTRPRVQFSDWRTADQRYYVSDTAAVASALGWTPRTRVRQGVRALLDWLRESSGTSDTLFPERPEL